MAEIQGDCRRLANVETGEKETPLGEKETPLGEKVTKVGEKANFVGEKKIIGMYWIQKVRIVYIPIQADTCHYVHEMYVRIACIKPLNYENQYWHKLVCTHFVFLPTYVQNTYVYVTR